MIYWGGGGGWALRAVVERGSLHGNGEGVVFGI